MAYKLTEFNQESIVATQRAWTKDLEHAPNYFPSDANNRIEFIKKHSTYGDVALSSLAYGVFADHSHVADSIVEVIITKENRKFVKMLDCAIRPSIIEKAFNEDRSAIEKLIDIYSETINGTILIGDDHNANVVKVYGRTHGLLTILRIVARLLTEHLQASNTFNVSIEGRWLVVKPVRKLK